MTEFHILFKKKRWYYRREKTIVHGDSYFISSTDSAGYARFVIIEYSKDDGKHHKFVCNAHDVLYVKLILLA